MINRYCSAELSKIAPRARIVEFFGLPGVGKTSLAENFALNNSLSLIEMRNKFERCLFLLLYALSRPVGFFRYYSVLKKQTADNKKLFAHKRHLFFAAVAKEAKARLTRGRLVVDDGLVQFALALYEREIEDKEAKALLHHLDRDRAVIIIEAPEAARLKRMDARGRIPRLFLGTDYLKNWQPVLQHNYQVLKRVIIEDFQSVVIENS